MTGKETLSGNTIHKTIHMNAPVFKVWRALTDPALMASWMLPDAEMHINACWEAGGPIIFRGDLHGIPYENKGTILQFEPEKLLAYNHWSSLSQHADIPEHYSLITFRLTATGEQTTLTFTQSNFATEVIYQHFRFYRNTALELLRKMVES